MFTLEYIKELFPESMGNIQPNKMIEGMMTDSRIHFENSLFVPIRGERFDAHEFLKQAINHGAIATLWDRRKEIPSDAPTSFVFFLVDDTVEALQQLANKYRQDVDPIVIGITGSNGKTTTKDLVHSVLQTKYKTHCTSGNFNNEIGLPLTVLQMERDTEVLVLEMGMSAFGEIDLLSKIARPDYAIITNIGESHIEHLGSREGIAEAKLEIKNGLRRNGWLFIDGDEALLQTVKQDDKVVSIGFSEYSDVTISEVQLKSEKTVFQIGSTRYEIPLLGMHHAKNAAFAIEIGRQLALTTEQIQRGLITLQHTSMRFERLIGKNNVTVINDAYNASPTSMKAAIEVVKQMTTFKKKIVVLGDILELGEYSESLHRSVVEAIDTPIDIVYTYGNEAKFIHKEIMEKKQHIQAIHFHERAALINKLQEHLSKETVILFKASRGMKFEQLTEEITNE